MAYGQNPAQEKTNATLNRRPWPEQQIETASFGHGHPGRLQESAGLDLQLAIQREVTRAIG